jgi:FkbM family methyltransferase
LLNWIPTTDSVLIKRDQVVLSLPMIVDYLVLVKPDWEQKERDFVSKLNLDNSKDKVIIDLGAYVGYYTAVLSRIYPQAKIIAVEASPSVFGHLKKNCLLNNIANLTLINKAISDEDDHKVEFYEKHSMSTFLREYLAFLFPNYDEENFHKEIVTTLTIDTLASKMNLEEISLLKVDIEGAEVLALRGALTMLREGKIKNMMIEYHSFDNYTRLIEMINQFGYSYSVDTRYEILNNTKYVNGHIMASLM